MHVYLSRDEFPMGDASLPPRLQQLVSQISSLYVHYVSGNIRSYKKLVYALSDFPDATIVTADDDVLYPRHWLEMLVDGNRRFPESVVGTRGTTMVIESGTALAPYETWPEAVPSRPSRSTFLTGRGGILYPPKSLDVRIATDMDLAMLLAPRADDVWFKAAALAAGTLAFRVPSTREYPSSGASQAMALFKTNVYLSENDDALRTVFNHFDLSI